MRSAGIPDLASVRDSRLLDDALDELKTKTEDSIRTDFVRRVIDFGSCPHRFECRGCGREEYLHFDEIDGRLQLSAKSCPVCDENLRGQIDTMLWNWIAPTQ